MTVKKVLSATATFPKSVVVAIASVNVTNTEVHSLLGDFFPSRSKRIAVESNQPITISLAIPIDVADDTVGALRRLCEDLEKNK